MDVPVLSRSGKIAQLNDNLRRTFAGGKVMMTAAIIPCLTNAAASFHLLVIVGIAAAALSTLAAALLAYFRGQINAGTKWALAPITRRLPWNQNNPHKESAPGLESDLTAHSDDRDQSFQRIATSVTRVRNGAVGCCF